MVVYLSAQMSKFLFGVSDLVKTECRNVMLLGDMDISRLMNHAQKVEGDKLRKMDKDNRKARTGNYEYSQQKSGGGNPLTFQQPSTFPVPSLASAQFPGLIGSEREGCFGCGKSGHRLKDFPSAKQGQRGNMAQSTTSVVPAGRPTQQGVLSGTGGGQCNKKVYALQVH
uniref:Retrotransposon gag protein n=1 Tax=Solanum tuberosum TaxID=4113 RepID=M1DZ91_SOLTU